MAVKKTQLYASLWASCDKLRGGMDSSEYKDYILTLLFMKYVTDKFKNKGAYEDIKVFDKAHDKDPDPECDFMSWQKPSKEKCPQCGGYMVEKGNKLVCADEQCGYVTSLKKEQDHA